MAGIFPSIGNSQNVDENGVPLAQATLTVYVGGTLGLATCYQDINLINVASNPMQADATGRLPLFYVADGVYRVRLVDVNGHLIYDYPQVASIGASTSGGGGTSVDPTTIFQTGDVIWVENTGVRNGWVRDNGRTIGSATSGASERANADCQPLFLFGWAQMAAGNPGWNVVGGAGVSAAADWAANKQITLPNKRGALVAGLDDMGNAPAGRYNGVPVIAGSTIIAGSALGENTHGLVTAEIPAHQHAAYVDLPTHTHLTGGTKATNTATSAGAGDRLTGDAANSNTSDNPVWTINNGGTQSVPARLKSTNAAQGSAVDDLTAATGGNGVHNNVPIVALGTFYRKL